MIYVEMLIDRIRYYSYAMVSYTNISASMGYTKGWAVDKYRLGFEHRKEFRRMSRIIL